MSLNSRTVRDSNRLVFLVLALTPAHIFAQSESPHWGLEFNGGYLRALKSLSDLVQDRYQVSLTGISSAVGLVRFHGNGAPSFTLQFLQLRVDGRAVEQWFPNRTFEGDATVPGFLATKHFNFISGSRGSMGLSLGAGVGPQLKASYRAVEPAGVSSFEKTYTLQELDVTPLFQILLRGDVRVSRHISVGPFFGTQNGLLSGGAALRVHFLK